jgi:hypothetical protein
MKKIIFTIAIVSSAVFASNAFSQTNNTFGFRVETGIDREITKNKSEGGAFRIFATPFWNLKDNTSIGVGAGFEIHLEEKPYSGLAEINAEYGSSVSPEDLRFLKDYANVVSFPFYVSALQKFSYKRFTPFVEGKLGYTYRDRYDAWNVKNFFTDHPDEEVEIRSTRKGGLFFSPSVGLLFPVKKKHYFSASIAYSLDRTSFESYAVETDQRAKGSYSIHSAAFRIGYIF